MTRTGFGRDMIAQAVKQEDLAIQRQFAPNLLKFVDHGAIAAALYEEDAYQARLSQHAADLVAADAELIMTSEEPASDA
ncbi:hypothetical protein [Sphingomonas sp.]|uniref:hypothetical protein n=1 Tax=Sphingomonas sp. TaxID=28214 RepID=UPI003B001CC7